MNVKPPPFTGTGHTAALRTLTASTPHLTTLEQAAKVSELATMDLGQAWSAIVEPTNAALLPRAAVELVLVRALRAAAEAAGFALPADAELFAPGRMGEVFGAIEAKTEAAAAQEALRNMPGPAAVAALDLAIRPDELEKIAVLPTDRLLRLITLGAADHLLPVHEREFLTMVEVVRGRVGQRGENGTTELNLQKALCSAVADDSSLLTPAHRTLLHAAAQPEALYLGAVREGEGPLRAIANRAYAVVHGAMGKAAAEDHAFSWQMAIRGNEAHRAALGEAEQVKWAKPAHIATTIDPATLAEATRSGAARLLERLGTELVLDVRGDGYDRPQPNPLAEAAERVEQLLKPASDFNPRESFDRNLPRYEDHLTHDELKAAMATAYRRHLGVPKTEATVLHLDGPFSEAELRPLWFAALAELMRSGDAVGIELLQKQILTHNEAQTFFEGRHALTARLQVPGYDALEIVAADRVLERIRTEAFSDEAHQPSQTLATLVDWLTSSAPYEDARLQEGERPALVEDLRAALTAARNNLKAPAAATTVWIDRISGRVRDIG